MSDETRAQGVEKYLIKLVVGGDEEVEIELLRHLSPLTAERLYRNLPFEGMIVRDNDILYISSPIESRSEKPRNRMRKGNVAFSPSKKMILIALSDIKVPEPVNPLGRVIHGLESLTDLRTGHRVRFERA